MKEKLYKIRPLEWIPYNICEISGVQAGYPNGKMKIEHCDGKDNLIVHSITVTETDDTRTTLETKTVYSFDSLEEAVAMAEKIHAETLAKMWLEE